MTKRQPVRRAERTEPTPETADMTDFVDDPLVKAQSARIDELLEQIKPLARQLALERLIRRKRLQVLRQREKRRRRQRHERVRKRVHITADSGGIGVYTLKD